MAPRAALFLGLLALAAVVVLSLAPSEPRRSGTNNVPATAAVARLAAGAETCQPEDIPASTRALRLAVEPAGGARVVVEIASGGTSPVGGRARVAADAGAVEVELSRGPAAGAARLCVRNTSRNSLALLGYPTGERGGRPTGPIRVDYYRGGSESWWGVTGALADRFAYGKSGLLGGGALWLTAGLVLTAWALAAAALWRIGAPE